MNFRVRNSRKKFLGFTLIELLMVIGILAVLLAITVIAINPFEKFSYTSDVVTRAVGHDVNSAIQYYFTSEKTLPWKKDASCRQELATGKTLTDVPSCINQLTEGGQLQASFMSGTEPKNVFITECSDAVALCYNPKSQKINQSADAKYTKNGVLNPECPSKNGTSSNCYVCTFSTNDAQECFQALNPNGTLAIVPSPAPNQVLPIPSRHSKNTCSNPVSGQVGCLAKVVTSSVGTPLSSIALTAGGLGPTQIHTAYNLPCTPGGPVASTCATPTTFGPQTIAIVDAYNAPTLEHDLAVYSQAYGLPPCTIANGCLTIANQYGETEASALPSTDANWALETSLDVEMAHAVCQTCKILVVESFTNSWYNIVDAENRAALMGATAISNSYGSPEASGETTLDSNYHYPGIFVTASSGDSGYGAYWPASSPYTIAVGGTTLSLFGDNTYASESVWNLGGSGCSAYETANSFQTSLFNWNLTGCSTKRSVADVSAVADPNTGVAVYDSTPYAGSSGWWILGGTSVSSPVISAALALTGSTPSGASSASFVYANSSKFRDVISGSTGSCGGTTACTAGVGYDGPTGLGSPNFLSFANVSPSPWPTPTPIPTLPPSSCTSAQRVSLHDGNIIGAPGDTVTDTLYITNTDPVGCSSTYTINTDGFPPQLTLTGIPSSITLTGGSTKSIQYTVQIPSITPSGSYRYQFRVYKNAETTPYATDGYIQVVVPSPSPSSDCSHFQSVSLALWYPVTLHAGEAMTNVLNVKSNDSPDCSSIYTISDSFPTGWTIGSIPSSFTLSGGSTKSISVFMQVPTNTTPANYMYQFWVTKAGQSSINPANGSIQVVAPTPTPTPTPTQTPINYALSDTKFLDTYAIFTYNDPGVASPWSIDVSFRPDFGGVVHDATDLGTGADADTFTRFAYAADGHMGDPGSISDNARLTVTSKLVAFQSTPNIKWGNYQQCGKTLYFRLVNYYDKTKVGPTNSGVIDCVTTVGVVDPPLSWYSVYDAVNHVQKYYEPAWDADKNGVINWNDMAIMSFNTRARYGGWKAPEITGLSSSTNPTPTPTSTQSNCTLMQTVTLTQTGTVIALPSDTVNNTLTVTSNDSPGCSSTYTVSQGFPTSWVVAGIPASFTLAGGTTKTIPFTITLPSTATVGNYAYQFWVAKAGQTSANPVNGYIQVPQTITPTPTPNPISCNNPWSQSLGSTSLSGNAGDTLNQTITITNNNSSGCNSITLPISYAYPSGFTILNLPPTVTVAPGKSVTVPFTITISTGAKIQDYLTQFWTLAGGADMNATIHVIGTAQPPQQQMFSNFGVKPYGNYALFEYSYNQYGTSDFRLDVATDPSALNQTTGPNPLAYYGFAYSSGNAMDASNTATPTSVRGFINSSPGSWGGWKCGSTVYYRMYNSGDLRIASPIQSAVVDCATIVDVLPWSPWYSAIYQGVYDARYDVDTNGKVDWNDYWILVRATRLR